MKEFHMPPTPTLMQNWKSELESWGWWHVELLHGDRQEEALQSARATIRQCKSPGPYCITTALYRLKVWMYTAVVCSTTARLALDIHMYDVRSEGQGQNDKSLEETLSDVKTFLGLTTITIYLSENSGLSPRPAAGHWAKGHKSMTRGIDLIVLVWTRVLT